VSLEGGGVRGFEKVQGHLKGKGGKVETNKKGQDRDWGKGQACKKRLVLTNGKRKKTKSGTTPEGKGPQDTKWTKKKRTPDVLYMRPVGGGSRIVRGVSPMGGTPWRKGETVFSHSGT